MAQGKKSFVVYTSWKIWLDGMTKEQKGDWIDWMFDYTNDLNPELPQDQVVKMACLMCMETLKRDLKKYEDKVERIKAVNETKSKNKDNDIVTKSTRNHNEIDSVNVNVNDNVNDNVNVNVLSNDNEKEINKEKPSTTRFSSPSLDEIKKYCQERNNNVNPEAFFNFYESKGWMVGKNKMKDWKAAIRTWEREAGFKSTNNDTPDDNGGFTEL